MQVTYLAAPLNSPKSSNLIMNHQRHDEKYTAQPPSIYASFITRKFLKSTRQIGTKREVRSIPFHPKCPEKDISAGNICDSAKYFTNNDKIKY